ncbi:prolyl endopeptidase-like [Raphidocelis subcapitata]|uniref:Prolyl endopeptidase n=1 Tax=Raphidocelis subcapitata TaxID=307507 RepID=A0A2V0NS18_9CHLO|nr:prolyl endopeptidase-like [Raphidocelis subcapitata]|eukprot:GBF90424.1 prolyl endopeptidase-like [Raphidocelis subcapitata]
MARPSRAAALALAVALACLVAAAAAAPARAAASRAGARLSGSKLGIGEPPVARRKPHRMKTNGETRVDDYYWLRDDSRGDAEVLEYLEAENKYAAAAMEDTKELQERLFGEMKGRIKESDVSVPSKYNGYWYYARTVEGSQYEVHCRRAAGPAASATGADMEYPDVTKGAAEGEEVILDENRRREEIGAKFFAVDAVEVSPDQKLLAWAEDTVGGEKYTVHVKELATGRAVSEPIPETSGSVVWANDNATLFYVVKDKLDRPYKVMRHKIGTPVADDVAVFEEPDEAFYVAIGKDFSEKLLYIQSGSSLTSEILYLGADDPSGEWKVVLPRSKNVDYSVAYHPGPEGGEPWFMILLRDERRPNSEALVAPVSDPSRQTVLLPHRADVQLDGVGVSSKYVIANERANATVRVVYHELAPGGPMPTAPLGAGTVIGFDEAVYDLSGGITGEFESEVLRLYYNSMTTPTSIIDHHIGSGRRAVRKTISVLGGFSKDDYASERVWATSPDGTRVPISLVYRKDLFKQDGTAKMLLYGYGSYGSSMDPTFDSKRLSLLDRGWVYGIAHIRGGGDLGRLWYEDGKFLKKRHTFEDFVAAAELLVQANYTSPEGLAIEGRSAGGMLIGAVLNMRPDLFNSAIAGVPFVDCLTTMLDPSIPLTITEYEEWGNPELPEYYEYMKSYSPVDNVKPQRYPHMLVTAGLHDPRVGYWEPAKWVAKLRSLKTDDSVLLLKTELGAGHFSVTGRFDRLKERAAELAFILKAAGQMDAAPLAGSGAAASPAAAAA